MKRHISNTLYDLPSVQLINIVSYMSIYSILSLFILLTFSSLLKLPTYELT